MLPVNHEMPDSSDTKSARASEQLDRDRLAHYAREKLIGLLGRDFDAAAPMMVQQVVR